jgi:hypothetical protein
MALIKCVNRACPYANKLTKDGMCEIITHITSRTDPIRTPDGKLMATINVTVEADTEEERKRKRDCLCEDMDRFRDGISAEVITDEEVTENGYISAKFTCGNYSVAVLVSFNDGSFAGTKYYLAIESKKVINVISSGSTYDEAVKNCRFDRKSKKKGFVALGEKLAKFKEQFEDDEEFVSFILQHEDESFIFE